MLDPRHLTIAAFLLTSVSCSPGAENLDVSDTGVDQAQEDMLVCHRDCFCPCGSYSIPCNSGAACICDCGDAGVDASSEDASTGDASAEDAAGDLEDVSTGPTRVLLFSKTEGFRHGSIPDAIAAIEQLGVENDFQTEATENAAVFAEETLSDFDAVVFVMTTGDVLSADQQAALEAFIQDGGGWVGIHSASDTEYDWPWYGALVGAYFDNHPSIQEATVEVEDLNHPSTAHLDREWVRRDEWYNFAENPRGTVHVLATLDESTYDGGSMGDDHPIAWCHEYDGGRSWYTGGGHTADSYGEPEFVDHLRGGILWAAGLEAGDCTP